MFIDNAAAAGPVRAWTVSISVDNVHVLHDFERMTIRIFRPGLYMACSASFFAAFSVELKTHRFKSEQLIRPSCIATPN